MPLAVEDDYGPVAPDDRYRADVVYLGSGGRGNKQPATTRHYLEPAKRFDFALWGAWWDHDYWAAVLRRRAGEERVASLLARTACRSTTSRRSTARRGSSSGTTRTRQREWGMWNNRVFEVARVRRVPHLRRRRRACAEEFGEGIVITAGGEETARLIAHYLERPDERARIGRIGRPSCAERLHLQSLGPIRSCVLRAAGRGNGVRGRGEGRATWLTRRSSSTGSRRPTACATGSRRCWRRSIAGSPRRRRRAGLGAPRRVLRGRAWRVAGGDRRQRRGQEHAPQDRRRHRDARPPGASTSACRISTQLALGSGFHPYLTGRDNVFLQGSDPRHVESRRCGA